MRGSISQLNKKKGCGFIRGEDDCEAYFDVSSLEGMEIRLLSVGDCVDYQEHFGAERLRAARVKVVSHSRAQAANRP